MFFFTARDGQFPHYVDLYFLLRDSFSIENISMTAIFGDLFSEKMFRAQLCYFEDVDYTEEVEYLIPDPPSEEEIRNSLTEMVQKGL